MKWKCSQVRMQLCVYVTMLVSGLPHRCLRSCETSKEQRQRLSGGERGVGAAHRLDLLASLGAWLCLGHVDARNFN